MARRREQGGRFYAVIAIALNQKGPFPPLQPSTSTAALGDGLTLPICSFIAIVCHCCALQRQIKRIFPLTPPASLSPFSLAEMSCLACSSSSMGSSVALRGSSSGTAAFQPAIRPLAARRARQVAVAALDPATVYAVTQQGIAYGEPYVGLVSMWAARVRTELRALAPRLWWTWRHDRPQPYCTHLCPR